LTFGLFDCSLALAAFPKVARASFIEQLYRRRFMCFRLAIVGVYVRSTLDGGGSTPPWSSSSVLCQGGAEPPPSKVLRTAILISSS